MAGNNRGFQYAVYRGEKLLVIGSVSHCAQQLGIKEDTVRWLASPAAKRRDNGKRMVAEKWSE